MPAFRYKAKDANGKMVTGIVTADHARDAHYRIEGRGHQVIEINAAVLRKPRSQVDFVPRRSYAMVAKHAALPLVLLFLLALAAFYYFDPYELRVYYGLP